MGQAKKFDEILKNRFALNKKKITFVITVENVNNTIMRIKAAKSLG